MGMKVFKGVGSTKILLSSSPPHRRRSLIKRSVQCSVFPREDVNPPYTICSWGNRSWAICGLDHFWFRKSQVCLNWRGCLFFLTWTAFYTLFPPPPKYFTPTQNDDLKLSFLRRGSGYECSRTVMWGMAPAPSRIPRGKRMKESITSLSDRRTRTLIWGYLHCIANFLCHTAIDNVTESC